MAVYDCTCDAEGIDREFVREHFALGHTVARINGEGHPVARRFIIRRHKLEHAARHPWVLRDRSRPAYLGHFATRELALAAVYQKVRQEKNLPSIDEIKAAMSNYDNDVQGFVR